MEDRISDFMYLTGCEPHVVTLLNLCGTWQGLQLKTDTKKPHVKLRLPLMPKLKTPFQVQQLTHLGVHI